MTMLEERREFLKRKIKKNRERINNLVRLEKERNKNYDIQIKEILDQSRRARIELESGNLKVYDGHKI